MGTTSATRVVDAAATFKHELSTGVPIDDALQSFYEAGSNPEIVGIATEMLAADGTIDMKALAGRAGMSRASLYRYYPDRRQLESEIAAKGAEGMAAAAALHADRPGKLRALGEYLIDHPGQAAAMVPLAVSVSPDVVRTTTEAMTGNPVDSAWIVGFAVMAATPSRTDDDVTAIRTYLDETVAELS